MSWLSFIFVSFFYHPASISLLSLLLDAGWRKEEIKKMKGWSAHCWCGRAFPCLLLILSSPGTPTALHRFLVTRSVGWRISVHLKMTANLSRGILSLSNKRNEMKTFTILFFLFLLDCEHKFSFHLLFDKGKKEKVVRKLFCFHSFFNFIKKLTNEKIIFNFLFVVAVGLSFSFLLMCRLSLSWIPCADTYKRKNEKEVPADRSQL